MVKCLYEWRNQRKHMTRNGKIARLPAALRQELNQRLFDGEQGQGRSELYAQRLEIEQNKHPKPEKKKKERKLTPEEKKQRIRQILGLGPGYDGSINPELTRPPELRGAPVQASTSQVQVNLSEYNL